MTIIVCPECGANLPNIRFDRENKKKAICDECGAQFFVVTDKFDQVTQVVCPYCSNLTWANKLEREGTAEVPCRNPDCQEIICVSTDRRGKVIGVEIKKPKVVKKSSLGGVEIITLFIVFMFLLAFLRFFLSR